MEKKTRKTIAAILFGFGFALLSADSIAVIIIAVSLMASAAYLLRDIKDTMEEDANEVR